LSTRLLPVGEDLRLGTADERRRRGWVTAGQGGQRAADPVGGQASAL